MGKHVDGCQQIDVLMDNCLSSLDQVGSGNGIVFGPCCQVTRNTAFPLPVIDYAHSGGVANVNECRWLQVSEFLEDKLFYLNLLCVEVLQVQLQRLMLQQI
jgi:hypothetical protein